MSNQMNAKNSVPLQIAALVLLAIAVAVGVRVVCFGTDRDNTTLAGSIMLPLAMAAMATGVWCMYFGIRNLRGNKLFIVCAIVVTDAALVGVAVALIPPSG